MTALMRRAHGLEISGPTCSRLDGEMVWRGPVAFMDEGCGPTALTAVYVPGPGTLLMVACMGKTTSLLCQTSWHLASEA